MNENIINIVLAAILVYYILLQGSYMVLIFLGAWQQKKYHKDVHVGDWDRLMQSPTTLPFTVIIPAYNEERIIVATTQAALALEYPKHEVIVVNDGSSDQTLSRLVDFFGLSPVGRTTAQQLRTQPVRAVYASPEHPGLLVVDKANGRRADAINAGANYSQFPMLCIMDADCVFESDALVRSIRPFQNSSRVVAATGIVRPANGLQLRNGKIVDFSLPKTWWGLVQAVEYLRSFQWARLGLARLGSMMSISGAFMVVKRKVFVEMGGCDPSTITDDIEFTMRLQRYVHENHDEHGRRMEIAFIPDPVSYTEVPERLRDYIDQRDRWQRGTLQATFKNFSMMFNPKYGAAGLVGMPYYFLFETLACIVEGASYVIVIAALALGYATWAQAGVFFLLAIVLGTLVSIAAVLLEERTRHRTQTPRDLNRLLLASLVDNLGFHQLHLLVRIIGSFEFLVRNKVHVNATPRYGAYQTPSTVSPIGQQG